MSKRYETVIPSPLGPLRALEEDGFLRRLDFAPEGLPSTAPTSPLLEVLASELARYFRGEAVAFSVPLAPQGGTPFQKEVWAACQAIPYGAKASYGELAEAIGRPKAARAVGHALGANPLPIVIPCHRVVGQRGTLTGYGGGLWRKRALLALEAGRPLLRTQEARSLAEAEAAIAEAPFLLLYLSSADCGACEVMAEKVRRGLVTEDLTMLHLSLERVSAAKGAFLAWIGPVLILYRAGRELRRVAGIMDSEAVIAAFQKEIHSQPFTAAPEEV